MTIHTHSNINHDFYKIKYRGTRLWLYNIVSKGEKKPTQGFIDPMCILQAKGYTRKDISLFNL